MGVAHVIPFAPLPYINFNSMFTFIPHLGLKNRPLKDSKTKPICSKVDTISTLMKS